MEPNTGFPQNSEVDIELLEPHESSAIIDRDQADPEVPLPCSPISSDPRLERVNFPQEYIGGYDLASEIEMNEPKPGRDQDVDATILNEAPDDSVKIQPRPWKAAWMRWGPISGLLCILAALCSILAALAVLLVSDGSPTEDWQIEPASYLSAFNAIIQQTLRIAVMQGVIITWWTKALKGTTLRELHYEYEWLNGLPGWSGFRSGYRVTLIGIACIASAIVAVDGPLLQRASTVVSTPITNHPVRVNSTIAPELPPGHGGLWKRIQWNDAMVGSLLVDPFFNETIPTATGTTANNIQVLATGEFDVLIYEYFIDHPIPDVILGCQTSCSMNVLAPALAITASSSHVVDVDHNRPWNAIAAQLPFVPDRLAFFIDVTFFVENARDKINLITGYSSTHDCIGTFNYTFYTLESAVAEYTIKVDNGTVSPKDISAPRILALANNTGVEIAGIHNSTILGVATMAYRRYGCASLTGHLNGNIYTIEWGASNTEFAFRNNRRESQCFSYIDPAPAVLESMNQLMFRVGVWAAKTLASSELIQTLDPGLKVNTTILGQVRGMENVFQTNLLWFLAAALVELMCISLILLTYMGWWRLGRPFSFSSLELAKAFEAPLMAECNSNSSGNDIAKALGDCEVRYGAIDVSPGQHGEDEIRPDSKLALAELKAVYQPLNTFDFRH